MRPELGLRLATLGPGVTVKGTPMLLMPPTETTTFPLAAPAGTGAMMRVSDQLVVRAATPLNSSELALVPTVGPKFVPVTLTAVPMGPALGLTPLMCVGGVAGKGGPSVDVARK